MVNMEYETESTDIFDNWIDGLKDIRAKVKMNVRISRAKKGNFGDWKTEAGEVRAMRDDYGPGYRMYYVVRNNNLIFFLCGGVKKSQSADIKKAVELAKEI